MQNLFRVNYQRVIIALSKFQLAGGKIPVQSKQ